MTLPMIRARAVAPVAGAVVAGLAAPEIGALMIVGAVCVGSLMVVSRLSNRGFGIELKKDGLRISVGTTGVIS